MKQFIALAIMALASLTASAKVEPTAQFHAVSVNAPVHLVIVPGPAYSVNLMSRNEQLTSAVSWKVKDGKLFLSARDMESLQHSNASVTVVVTAPEAIEYNLTSDVQQTEYKELKTPRRIPHFGRRHR